MIDDESDAEQVAMHSDAEYSYSSDGASAVDEEYSGAAFESLDDYLAAIDQAIENCDSNELCVLVVFAWSDADVFLQTFRKKLKVRRDTKDEELRDVFVRNLDANLMWAFGDKENAFKSLKDVLNGILGHLKKMSSNDEEPWLVPAFIDVLRRLGKLALELQDENLESNAADDGSGNSETIPDTCVDIYGRLIIHFINSFSNFSSSFKAAGSIAIPLVFFKFGFQHNKLALISAMFNNAEYYFRDLSDQRMRERLQLLYCLGRWATVNNQFETAYEYFENLFTYLPKSSQFHHNVKCTLKWFIPLKMLRGVMPTKYLCERYDLMHYYELSQIIRQGQLGQYENHTTRYFLKYSSLGLIDLIMKLKILVVRNFVRKCASANGILNPKAPINIRYTLFQAALNYVNSNLSLEAFEFELCNLIFKKFITGVISPGVGMSLSKSNAFPSYDSIIARGEGSSAAEHLLI